MIVVGLVCAELVLRGVGLFVLEYQYSHTTTAQVGNDDTVVLCVGESTTAGLWVPSRESYPKQLERALRTYYKTDAIKTIIPPHIGQNSSQQANRFRDYLDRYHPSLVILMAGANNEWALNESHIPRFFKEESSETLGVRARILLDGFRVFKVLRRATLIVFGGFREHWEAGNRIEIWGESTKTPFPPRLEVYDFADRHRDLFRLLWRHDLRFMIDEAKSRSIPVVLMSYPVKTKYLNSEHVRQLASESGVIFIDNEATFTALEEKGVFERYMHDDDWHPRPLGYTVITNSIFEKIVERDLLKLSLKSTVASE